MGKQFPWLSFKHISKYNSWELNGTKYWRLFIVEYFQPTKLRKKSKLNPIYSVSWFFFAEEQHMKTPAKVSMKVQGIARALFRMSIWSINHLYAYFCGIRSSLIFFLEEGHGLTFIAPARVYRKYQISVYFMRKIISHSLPKEKISCFRGKKTSFQIVQEGSCPGTAIFSEHLKKIYVRVFFWERSSFIFHPSSKIIFSGKRNIIFPNNTRKIIFQRNFFGKTIFSGRLEKTKYGFLCSVLDLLSLCWKVKVC